MFYFVRQSLFQRQLASLRDRLDSMNHASTNSVTASLSLPDYTRGNRTWAAPRQNVSASLSDIKGGFDSQRQQQRNKLMNALLAVSLFGVRERC
jgi:hypothetical protein